MYCIERNSYREVILWPFSVTGGLWQPGGLCHPVCKKKALAWLYLLLKLVPHLSTLDWESLISFPHKVWPKHFSKTLSQKSIIISEDKSLPSCIEQSSYWEPLVNPPNRKVTCLLLISKKMPHELEYWLWPSINIPLK